MTLVMLLAKEWVVRSVCLSPPSKKHEWDSFLWKLMISVSLPEIPHTWARDPLGLCSAWSGYAFSSVVKFTVEVDAMTESSRLVPLKWSLSVDMWDSASMEGWHILAGRHLLLLHGNWLPAAIKRVLHGLTPFHLYGTKQVDNHVEEGQLLEI